MCSYECDGERGPRLSVLIQTRHWQVSSCWKSRRTEFSPHMGLAVLALSPRRLSPLADPTGQPVSGRPEGTLGRGSRQRQTSFHRRHVLRRMSDRSLHKTTSTPKLFLSLNHFGVKGNQRVSDRGRLIFDSCVSGTGWLWYSLVTTWYGPSQIR